MAQDFESTGSQITDSETTLLTANSDDAIIGLRLTNVTASTITVDVYIDKGGVGTDRYIAKDLSIPPASSVELIQGGAKVVLQNGDVLYGLADTATSVDVWLSRVDSIST
jgi:copper(I)-binding protein